uniref:AlNc14C24G2419 protein n=1 Tax=Albugo laibachii Nc14 TaxID=890382 RepID=F0W6C0_9STRA|nr:AlNc14C24G2419 [Albugo laibachii Nc14]|eukprot:CCA16663.1 AlNc14C24G2419 [Albugo laibachii Nc14]
MFYILQYGYPLLTLRDANRLTPDFSSPIVAAFARGLCAAEPSPSKTDPPRLTQAPLPSTPPLRDTETGPRQEKRSPQAVSTIGKRVKVACWSADKEEKEGSLKGLLARAVDEFPDISNPATRNANLVKAAPLWKPRYTILGAPRGSRELSSRTAESRKGLIAKITGRTRNTMERLGFVALPRAVGRFRPSKKG